MDLRRRSEEGVISRSGPRSRSEEGVISRTRRGKQERRVRRRQDLQLQHDEPRPRRHEER